MNSDIILRQSERETVKRGEKQHHTVRYAHWLASSSPQNAFQHREDINNAQVNPHHHHHRRRRRRRVTRLAASTCVRHLDCALLNSQHPVIGTYNCTYSVV